MDQAEFLAQLGFNGNPFDSTNADEEDLLQEYFIPPPYFASVWGDPGSPRTHVIFAPRGGGKSAQRRMIEYRAAGSDVFVVTYDRFEHVYADDLRALPVDYHLNNVVRLLLLGFLLEVHTRGLLPAAFSGVERRQLEALCSFYLGGITTAEAQRAAQALKTLSTRARQLLAEWAAPLSALISAVLGSHGLLAGGVAPVGGSSGTAEAVSAPAKAHLDLMLRLILSLGFKSVYVLVDKVDETAATGNNAEASFLLMRPLLRDLELLQTPGLGFKFFLWDKLEHHYREYARPDRIEQFRLAWTGDEINRMLSRRLGAFSQSKVRELDQLVTADLGEALQYLVVLFASGSPRDMIRVCQDILSEQLQLDADSAKLGGAGIIRGIAKFCENRARELLGDPILRDLRRVGRLDFTANYIANDILKVDVNSARSKIARWVETGAVEKVGELPSGGRPVYHYAVTDVRVARAMLPNMGFAEFLTHKVKSCCNCRAPLLRDWDLRPIQGCHRCGTNQQPDGPQ